MAASKCGSCAGLPRDRGNADESCGGKGCRSSEGAGWLSSLLLALGGQQSFARSKALHGPTLTPRLVVHLSEPRDIWCSQEQGCSVTFL